MNLIYRLCLAAALTAGSIFPSAAADSNFYGIVGVGQSQLREKDPALKDRTYDLFGQEVTLGISTKDQGTSTVTQLGLGYRFSKYLDVQASYLQGFKASRSYRATLTSGGRQLAAVDAVYRIQMDGFEFSLVPAWPVTENISLTGRVGGFWGRAQARVTSPIFPSGYAIEVERRSEWLPVLGVGLRYRITDRIEVAAEYIGVNKKYGLARGAVHFRF